MLAGNEVIALEDPMSKNIVLAVDAASGDAARRAGAAADGPVGCP
jgi:hypothetical protein